MMSPSESYLASIADHVPYDELDAVEADIEREEGPAALFRCLEARLAAEVERGGSEEEILGTRSRLASAGERVALSQEDVSAIQVSLQTFEIWRELGDDEGCGRSACRALELALQAREQVQEVIDALEGHEKALFWIRKNLPTPCKKHENNTPNTPKPPQRFLGADRRVGLWTVALVRTNATVHTPIR